MQESSGTRMIRVVMAGLAIGVFFLSGYYLGSHRAAQTSISFPPGTQSTLSGETATNAPAALGSCPTENGGSVPCLVNTPPSTTCVNGAAVPMSADFAQFWKAWNIINEKYVPTVSPQVSDEKKVWGAIGGLAASLGDPYTFFLQPEEKTIFEQDVQGKFGGVGMQIGMKDGFITVISPLKGSPAERAGIKEGDKIFRIDGATTTAMSIDRALYLIRGEIGKPVALSLVRAGVDKPIEVTVVREDIQVPTIKSDMKDGVFIISLYGFPATGADLFREALRDFTKSGSDKLVLDLRGNPGGYLEVAVDMASWFLPPGKIVVKEEEKGGGGQVFRSKGYNIFGDNFKFVILVDGGSASAAEILAGALNENGVATLVGIKTFGKGSVQELIPISDKTSLKLTVARWITPNGTNLSAGGLDPDIKVEITKDDIEHGRDPQMDKAIQVVKGLK